MPHPEKLEKIILDKKSPYLFHNPETFINNEMREWLSKSTIAHIAPLWLPLPRQGRNYGGAEDVVINNITKLDSFGIKSQVIYGNPNNKSMEGTLKSISIKIPEGIDPNEDLLNLLRTNRESADRLERTYVLQAYQQIADKSDDITIIHDHTIYGRDHGIWVSEFLKPVVRTEHGPLVWPGTTRNEEFNLKQFIGRDSLGFIAISKNQMNQIPELNWVGVNYNGVDLDEFDYREEKDNYLLYLGRVNKDKGIHNAIEAAKKAKMPLVIAGQVEENQENLEFFEREIKPHINDKSVYHIESGVNSEERKEWLSHAKALMMLIEWDEPFGMVMAEALASGTPIVGYPRGSVPEVVKEKTGYVVNNMDEAVEAIKKIIQGKTSPVECRTTAERFFSAEAMASRYTKIYMKQTNKFQSLSN